MMMMIHLRDPLRLYEDSWWLQFLTCSFWSVACYGREV